MHACRWWWGCCCALAWCRNIESLLKRASLSDFAPLRPPRSSFWARHRCTCNLVDAEIAQERPFFLSTFAFGATLHRCALSRLSRIFHGSYNHLSSTATTRFAKLVPFLPPCLSHTRTFSLSLSRQTSDASSQLSPRTHTHTHVRTHTHTRSYTHYHVYLNQRSGFPRLGCLPHTVQRPGGRRGRHRPRADQPQALYGALRLGFGACVRDRHVPVPELLRCCGYHRHRGGCALLRAQRRKPQRRSR
jgi:hypothetical protein